RTWRTSRAALVATFTVLPSTGGRGYGAEREVHPGPAAERLLERVDGLLHQRPLGKVTLAGSAAIEDLVGEVAYQAGIEQEFPRLARMATGWEVAGRNLGLDELG